MIRLRTVKLVIFGEIPAAAERFKIFFLTLFVFRTKKGKTEYFANILNTLKAMKLLEGKVAVVTGAARGIGKAIALEFAKEGADVAFTDLVIDDNGKATEAEIAALGVTAKGYASNAANFEETHKVIEEIVKDFGRIDILVNNAGITKDGLMMRMSEAQWDAVLTVNLKSAFNFIHAVTPVMARQKGGSIINMSSVVGVSGNAGQCGVESRHDRSCQVDRQGDGSPRHPRQRHRSGLHHDRDDRQTARRGEGGLVQADSAPPRRHAGGRGQGRAVPRIGSFVVCQRTSHPLLRRDELLGISRQSENSSGSVPRGIDRQ